MRRSPGWASGEATSWTSWSGSAKGRRERTAPCSAALLACTAAGDWAVLLSGLVTALAIAAGVTLTARQARAGARA